jgi:hypothetical protein
VVTECAETMPADVNCAGLGKNDQYRSDGEEEIIPHARTGGR